MSEADAQQGAIPAALAERMTAAAGTPGRAPDVERLATAAFVALRAALAHGRARAAAFDLLAADALLTAACEALTDGELPAALAPARFQALLEDE